MFNNQLLSLITELINYFDDSKMKILKEKISIVTSVNSTLIITLFLNNIYKFKDNIMKKEESFFLKHITPDNVSDLYSKNKELATENNINIIDVINLKDYWTSLHNDDKETIWKYFQVLIVLSEKWALQNIKTI
mgnify:FL=1|tara:strand:- start:569 stop:970 length:402 start_codon:yes stop_codon:yes gene_type:complete